MTMMNRRMGSIDVILLLTVVVQQGSSTKYTLQMNSTDIYEWPRLVYPVDFNLCKGKLDFNFKTFNENALVLYQDDHGQSDFISVSLVNGRLVFMMGFGRGPLQNFTTTEDDYGDFRWHTVSIELSSFNSNDVIPRVLITVDGKIVYNKLREKSCQLESKLLIGGLTRERLQYSNSLTYQNYKSFYSLATGGSRRGYLNACIGEIRYGKTQDSMIDITNRPAEKYLVEKGCNLNYCHKPDPICKNNGRCTPGTNNDVNCDCLWTGFTGDYCTEPVLELTLNGSYRVKHMFTNKALKTESYGFRIKTLQDNALIFHAIGPDASKDYTLIELQKSRIRLTANFGAETYVLESSDIVSDGNWHTVKYRKTVKTITLIVDLREKRKRLMNELYVKMDYNGLSFLGKKKALKHEIKIQDFVWTNEARSINFVKELYETFAHGQGPQRIFVVEPQNILPKFNKELPNLTPKPFLPITKSNNEYPCTENECSTPSTASEIEMTTPLSAEFGLNDSRKDDKSSSTTWIVVATVVCVILVVAIIAFFVYKWNLKRQSGNFEVHKKPVAPRNTMIHYQESAHRKKQQQMRL